MLDQMLQPRDPPTAPPRIIAFTGTLGSGKTTVLNGLLDSPRMNLGNFIVIQNDIGALNVDASRVHAQPQQITPLTAGCICCADLASLRLELTRHSASLADQPAVDTILIETTGIADPGRIKELLAELKIPAKVLVTVAADSFDSNLARELLKGHVEAADIILLTWWDHLARSEDGKIVRVLEHCGAYAPGTPIVWIDRLGNVCPAPDIVVLPAIDCATRTAELPCVGGPFTPLSPALPPDTLGRKQPTHGQYSSYTIQLRPDITLAEIANFVTACAHAGIELIRAKGTLENCSFDFAQGRISSFELKDRPQGTVQQPLAANFIVLGGAIPQLLINSLKRAHDLESSLSAPSEAQRAAVTAYRIAAITAALTKFPESHLSVGGRPQVDFDCAQVWSTDVEKSDVPPELRREFYRKIVTLMLPLAEELRHGLHSSDPRWPYLMKRAGATLAWLAYARAAELESLGVLTQVHALYPASMWLDGFSRIIKPSQFGSFKAEELSGMILRTKQAAHETAVPEAATIERFSQAVAHLAASAPHYTRWNEAPEMLLAALSWPAPAAQV